MFFLIWLRGKRDLGMQISVYFVDVVLYPGQIGQVYKGFGIWYGTFCLSGLGSGDPRSLDLWFCDLRSEI